MRAVPMSVALGLHAFISAETAEKEQEHVMSIVAWILLGLVAGFIASKVVNHSGEGFFLDIVLGIVGALVGGFAFNLFGATGVSGFNVWSLFVAVMGAIMVLVIKHAVTGRRIALWEPGAPRAHQGSSESMLDD